MGAIRSSWSGEWSLGGQGKNKSPCLQLQVESWRLAQLSSCQGGLSFRWVCASESRRHLSLPPLDSNGPCTQKPKCVGYWLWLAECRYENRINTGVTEEERSNLERWERTLSPLKVLEFTIRWQVCLHRSLLNSPTTLEFPKGTSSSSTSSSSSSFSSSSSSSSFSSSSPSSSSSSSLCSSYVCTCVCFNVLTVKGDFDEAKLWTLPHGAIRETMVLDAASTKGRACLTHCLSHHSPYPSTLLSSDGNSEIYTKKSLASPLVLVLILIRSS